MAKRMVGVLKWSVRGFSSGSLRSTVALPPPREGIPFSLDYFGTDYKHWFVSVKEPKGSSRQQIIDHYVKIMTDFTGSEETARKKIYNVSTRYYYAFGALISEEEAERLKNMPHVLNVLPDAYVNRETKDYGGFFFILETDIIK
ncbi:multiple organellar RNA editing factor 6, mitochondrial-like [Apium graveolens]|uniref:multiple organellar RNA editing factor 6, mitochondrial-like n=1 Tax=Apium graveolens TaxID=4045 RepID=UPI003D7ADA5B